MSEKTTKLTPEILKRIISEEKEKLRVQAERVKGATKAELISEIKKLVNLRRKQKYLMQRLQNVSEQRKFITKKLRKRRS